MGKEDGKPEDVKEDPMTLGFQYLGDLQEKSLKALNDIKKLGEDMKGTQEQMLKVVQEGAAANAKLAQELSGFAAKVVSACDDTLAGLRLAREYLEEYKKERAAQEPTPQPKRKGPKPSSLSEVAEKIKKEQPPTEEKKE